ncbi:hypothetical protein Tco_0370786 [Tanacetum coccineum]
MKGSRHSLLTMVAIVFATADSCLVTSPIYVLLFSFSFGIMARRYDLSCGHELSKSTGNVGGRIACEIKEDKNKKKEEKNKKVADCNKPKFPASSFLIFGKETKKELSKEKRGIILIRKLPLGKDKVQIVPESFSQRSVKIENLVSVRDRVLEQSKF